MAGERIDLPRLVTSLDIDLSGIAGAEAEATREGTAVGNRLGASMGDATRARLQAAFRTIPAIDLHADASDAQREVQELRARMVEIWQRPVDVEVDTTEARAEIEEIEAAFRRLAAERPNIGFDLDTGRILAELESVAGAVRHIDEMRAGIEVDVDAGRAVAELEAVHEVAEHVGDSDGPDRAGRGLERLASSAGGAVRPLASIASTGATVGAVLGSAVPVVAGLSAALVAMAPAAGIAATALLSVGSAVGAMKIGTSGIGAAVQAAWAPATGGAAAAAGAAQQAAKAQRAVQDAMQQAADANEQAARRVQDAQRAVGDATKAAADAQVQAARSVAQAERNLADAQKASLAAQQALTDARKQASQDLEDLNNRLTDAGLDQRENTLRVQEAQETLAKTLADPTASERQKQAAQLAYEQAVQRLREQGVAYQRLQAQVEAANVAGVEGSAKVVSAQAKVADAARTVGDKTQAVADAQVQAADRIAAADRELADRKRALADVEVEQAKTAEKGLRQIADAQEALSQKAGGAAGGVDKLAEALGHLAPAARAFVEELISLKPQLDGLRLDVQQSLFLGLADTLRGTAEQVLPVLRDKLAVAASALNLMAKGALDTAGTMARTGVLGQALDSATRGLYDMREVPATIVQGLVQVGAAAGPSFERLSSAGGAVLDRLKQRMDASFASGGMQQAIEQAVTLIGQMGHVLGNVGSIVASVFGSAQTSGAGFVSTLEKVSAAAAAAFSTPAVQEGLRALFETMSQVASTAAPLLGQALQIIGPVIAALAPGVQALVAALGPALSTVLAALGPVLQSAGQALAQLAIAAAPLLPVVGQLVAALLPVLAPLLAGVSTICQQLAPVIGAVAVVLGNTLSPILGVLPDLIQPFVLLVTTLTATLLPILAQLIEQLPLPLLAQCFVQIVTALAPLLVQLATLAGQLLNALMPILLPIINLVVRLAAVFASDLGHAITGIIVPAVRLISSLLSGDLSGAAEAGKQVLKGMASAVVAVFWDLPKHLGDAFANLANSLLDVGKKIISSLIDGIKSGFNKVKDTLSSLTDLLPDWKGPAERDQQILTPAGQLIIDGLMAGIGARVPRLRDQLQGITAEIAGALTGDSLALAGSPGALTGAYAGGARPVMQQNTINMYGSNVSAQDVSRELSWQAGLGVR
ncbi:minor tail protein [Streptomyces phage mu1/6]|uniref:tail length tape measure protein n=1 Tax=Streptomyces phage mu1/6 TaxID=370623 RepID=UPI0000D4F6DB|nr:tail length tape measure protein [Streptomyces phage mu1/6]ABD94210.1 minor tail protein [Streptomyces phage mu1/6]